MQTENFLIRKPSLEKLFTSLIASGKTVFAPKKKENLALFEKVQIFAEITDDYIVTTNSAKTIVFPRAEKLFTYHKSKESTEIADAANDTFPDVILWGSRPCDAAAFIPLTETFNGDYQDVLFNKRRDKVLLMSFSCNKSDEYCFPTPNQIVEQFFERWFSDQIIFCLHRYLIKDSLSSGLKLESVLGLSSEGP